MHLGLPRDTATELVVQTMLGSAKLLRETGEHPTVLRERVTSPGGTTAAAIRQLEDHKVRAAFLGAIEAARDRSRDLAQAARRARARRRPPVRGRLVYSEELTRYDFGSDHPMAPGRVRNTDLAGPPARASWTGWTSSSRRPRSTWTCWRAVHDAGLHRRRPAG